MFKNLFRLLFGGHDHNWVIIDKDEVESHNQYGQREGITATRYVMRCTHCGNLKTEKIRF